MTAGSGSMRERRPGVWELRVSAPRQGQVSRTFHGDKRGARRALNRLLVDVAEGREFPTRQRKEKAAAAKSLATQRTFRAAAERWLDMVEADLAPGTVRSYRQNLRLYVYPAFGDRPLAELDTTEVDDLYIGLRKKGLAPATIRLCHTTVSGTLRMATRWGWAHTRPTENATLPRLVSAEIDAPDPSDVRRFIDTAEAEGNPELATLFFLAAATGARQGEVCALRWSDLDLDLRVMTIARNLTDLGSGRWAEKDTKTHAIRTIALDPGTTAALLQHQQAMAERARDGGAVLAANGFVFTSSLTGDRPWRTDSVRRSFRRIRRKLEVPESIKFHSLRHFSASQQLAAGIDVRTVAGRHGWKDATMPLNRYGHFIPAADAKAALVMGDLLRREDAPALPGGGTEEAGAEG